MPIRAGESAQLVLPDDVHGSAGGYRQHRVGHARRCRRRASEHPHIVAAGRVGHHAKVLVVVSGLPGTGKSTIADAIGRALGVPVFSVDPIEAALWRSGIPASHETGVAAYEVAATLAEHHLRLGGDAIVDAVSAIEIARDGWRQVAQRTAAELRVIEIVCSDKIVHRQRLEARRRDIEGFYEPSWEQVLARQVEYEPWLDRRLVLDSAEDLRANVTKALTYVRPTVAPT